MLELWRTYGSASHAFQKLFLVSIEYFASQWVESLRAEIEKLEKEEEDLVIGENGHVPIDFKKLKHH